LCLLLLIFSFVQFGLSNHISIIFCSTDSLIDSIETITDPFAQIWNPITNCVYFFGGTPVMSVLDCTMDSIVAQAFFYGSFGVLDSIDNKIYAADYGYSDIRVFDCANNITLEPLPTSGSAWDMVWSSVQSKLYHSSPEANQLRIFDCARDSLLLTRNFPILGGPGGLCAVPHHYKVYCSDADKIWIIDAITDSFIKEIPVRGLCYQIIFNSNSDLVFCLSDYDTMYVVNPASDSVTSKFYCQAGSRLYLNQRHNQLYVLRERRYLDVINCSNGNLITTIDLNEVDVVVHDTIDDKLYCCGNYSYDGVVRVVDCSSNVQIDSIKVVDIEPLGLAWAPSVNKLYCGGSDRMHSISSKMNQPFHKQKYLYSTVVRTSDLNKPGICVHDILGRDVSQKLGAISPGIYFITNKMKSQIKIRKVILLR
jgi:DNA-binding beta-propeller fold protein YncE